MQNNLKCQVKLTVMWNIILLNTLKTAGHAQKTLHKSRLPLTLLESILLIRLYLCLEQGKCAKK